MSFLISTLMRILNDFATLNERAADTAHTFTPDSIYELAYTRGKAAAYRRAAEIVRRAGSDREKPSNTETP